MIKIENVDVYGFEAAIRGMRNPLNSWHLSDSVQGQDGFVIGKNDYGLMERLVRAGSDHGKFMRYIGVTLDITAPLYWWPEFDAYKVGTVRNSCSKMHKLLHKPFEMSDFSFDKLPGYKNEIKQFKPDVDAEQEVWKALNPWCDVSDCGRIRNAKGRVLGGSLHADGYVFVTIDGKQHPLHRLIASVFCDGYEEGKVVNHKDGNKQNNFASNLEWVTQKENIQHSLRTGLQGKPCSTYKGKFTAEQREEIKAAWNTGEVSKRELAKKYGVSHTCINDIVNDKYKYAETVNLYEEVARPIVDTLNELRDSYFACDDEEEKKHIWYSILALLPESYNQTATIMLNYQVLRNMYHSRKNHKLSEWRELCEWIKTLPYHELITMEG